MREFYSMYGIGDYDGITLRFGFNSNDQIDFVMAYLEDMATSFLSQGADYSNVALGSVISRSIFSSYRLIYETLPNDLSTRKLASYNNINGKTCHTYIDPVATDTAQGDAICTAFDFQNVEQLKFFVNATWYGGESMTNLQTATTLSAAQTTTLFDPATSGSLGEALAEQSLAPISTQYSCKSSANCTAGELAGLQWGSAGVTLDPPVTSASPDYLPVANSVMDWWSTQWPAITQ